MDTSELGAGHNPTPFEKAVDISSIKIYITIETDDEFPRGWDDDLKRDYVKDNINEYIRTSDIKVEDIEIN